MVKGKVLTMGIEHRGHYVQQSSYNNHIMIVKDDRMVFHAQCTEKRTERQLRQLVDGYIKFTESGDAVDIWRDVEE